MTTSQNKSSCRHAYELINNALSTGDLGLLGDVIARDVVDHNPAPGQPPGLRGVQETMGAFRSAFPDLRFTIEDMIAEGDKVVCRLEVQGTHKGLYRGTPPTGKAVRVACIDVLRFADGKIAERWGQADEVSLLQQIGAAVKR